MMRIQDIIDCDLIIGDLQATDMNGVVGELAALIARKGKVQDARELARVILERESQCSTGIGAGIAVPHAKTRSVDGMIIAFGRSRSGVDFRSLDGKPVHLIFLLVSPEDRPGDHLRALARISRILRNDRLRGELIRAADAFEIHKLLLDEDSRYPQNR